MPEFSQQNVLPVAAIAIVSEGKLLTVRKSGTNKFQLPGGKYEAGETAIQTAIRETREEISVTVQETDLTLMGTWLAPAANEPGLTIESTVFLLERNVSPVIAAEIAEYYWLDYSGEGCRTAELQGKTLAPMIILNVLPKL